ncbi:MAG: hypothetical protein NTY64_08895 [Deltaproteobacteria bacterium]|nr:hypothetical protein [Deltaproteobacteria bacterium]
MSEFLSLRTMEGGQKIRSPLPIESAGSISDGFVKSPSAALRGVLRHCGVQPSTPHSSGFARLASGAFYFAIQILTFYEIIISGSRAEWAR